VTEIDLLFEKIMEHTYYLDDDLNEIELISANQRDWAGDTPLHVVTRIGWAWAIPILISHGAQVNIAGEHGLAPLHYAAFKNDLDSAAALLAHGADPNLRDQDGRSPIDWANTAGNEGMVSLLQQRNR
jgi:ankyrin repeat protein